MTPQSLPILYDQRQRYCSEDTTQTTANDVPPKRDATASPVLSGEEWLRRLEDMQASPTVPPQSLPINVPILYDQRQRYSSEDTIRTTANDVKPPIRAATEPALSGEAWLRRIEDMRASPAGVGESWLRDEEQGDSGHAATELLDLLEPRQAENSTKPAQRERRLSSEWREAMAARARQRFHAKPQAASAKSLRARSCSSAG